MGVAKVESLATTADVDALYRDLMLRPENFAEGFGAGVTHVTRNENRISVLLPDGKMPWLLAMIGDFRLTLDNGKWAVVGWERKDEIERGSFAFDTFGAFE